MADIYPIRHLTVTKRLLESLVTYHRDVCFSLQTEELLEDTAPAAEKCAKSPTNLKNCKRPAGKGNSDFKFYQLNKEPKGTSIQLSCVFVKEHLSHIVSLIHYVLIFTSTLWHCF